MEFLSYLMEMWEVLTPKNANKKNAHVIKKF